MKHLRLKDNKSASWSREQPEKLNPIFWYDTVLYISICARFLAKIQGDKKLTKCPNEFSQTTFSDEKKEKL